MNRTGLTGRTSRTDRRSAAEPREGECHSECDRDRLDRVLMLLLIAGSMAAMAVALHALNAMTGR